MSILRVLGAFAAFGSAFIFGARLAAADLQYAQLPPKLPTSDASISIAKDCPDRAASIRLLARLRSARTNHDPAFDPVDVDGVRYIVIRPRQADVTVPIFMSCFKTYMGTEADAKRIGLWVPDNRIPFGVMIYTQKLGFYGDPRAWHAGPGN